MPYKNEGFPADQSPFSANDFRNEFRKIGLSFTEYVSANDAIRGGYWTAEEAVGTAANRYALTLPSAPNVAFDEGYKVGMMVWWRPSATNSLGQVTVSVNGGPSAYIKNAENGDLESQAIPANGVFGVVYDGEFWRVIANPKPAVEPGTVIQPLTFNSVSGGALDTWLDVGGNEWGIYDDLLFGIETPSGWMYATVPTQAIRERDAYTIGESITLGEGISVFGGGDAGVDPSVLIARSNTGGIVMGFTSVRDTGSTMTLQGRRYTGGVASGRKDGWTPRLRLHVRNQKHYLERYEYIGGTLPLPKQGPSLITQTGEVDQVGGAYDYSGAVELDVNAADHVELVGLDDITHRASIDKRVLEKYGSFRINDNSADLTRTTNNILGIPAQSDLFDGFREFFNWSRYTTELLYINNNSFTNGVFNGNGNITYVSIPPRTAVGLYWSHGVVHPVGQTYYDGTLNENFNSHKLVGDVIPLLDDNHQTPQLLQNNVRMVFYEGLIRNTGKCHLFLSNACNDVMIFNNTGSAVINPDDSSLVNGEDVVLHVSSYNNYDAITGGLLDPDANSVQIEYGAIRRVIRSGVHCYAIATS